MFVLAPDSEREWRYEERPDNAEFIMKDVTHRDVSLQLEPGGIFTLSGNREDGDENSFRYAAYKA